MYVVIYPLNDHESYSDPEAFGPFETEDECYKFAATISQEPNDWLPLKVQAPPKTTVHVVAFRHKTPGEGVGGFEWDLDRQEAWRRAIVETLVAKDPNYETLVTTYEIEGTNLATAESRALVTDEIDAWLWGGEGWDTGSMNPAESDSTDDHPEGGSSA